MTFDMDNVGCKIAYIDGTSVFTIARNIVTQNKKEKTRVEDVVSLEKRQVLDQSHIHYITCYRSYKRTGTLINTLHTYIATYYFQTRHAHSRNRPDLSLKIILLTKLGSVVTVFLSDTIASNQTMRGTEYIGFDSLITSHCVHITLIKTMCKYCVRCKMGCYGNKFSLPEAINFVYQFLIIPNFSSICHIFSFYSISLKTSYPLRINIISPS